MAQRIIVTAALPYANGSLHLGHLVEYCQADIYVRALKRLGENAVYICANDAHGTPIEVNAGKKGLTPEAMVAQIHAEHRRDFATFDVAFDHFSSTHTPTNRAIVNTVYNALRAGGHLYDRQIDGNWCERDQRFLPDRFVRGACPKCNAPDQYGDVCEQCRTTYAPTDLKAAHCVLCGDKPSIKKSEHVFFRLSAHADFLRRYIDSGALQPDIANYVRDWIDKGLADWCISRDGPYFGFEIPDRPGKYFYVWLDAPFGYASTSVEWGKPYGLDFDALWRSPETRIEHIIGKDIVYFHTLFWPAVLHAVGYTLPSMVLVHGMLTVNGQKMSKSRGTFINAAPFAQCVDPQALRYYYASKYSAATDDLDLAVDDFVQRTNAELVNKHANLFSRAAQFLGKRLDNRLGDLPFAATEAQSNELAPTGSMLALAREVVAHCRRAETFYRTRQIGQVVRELVAVADIGNEFMQSQQPWDQIERDPEAARTTCTFALNVCHALAMYLWPIVPRFAEAGARVLDCRIERLAASDLFKQRLRPIGAMERLFERIDKSALAPAMQPEVAPVPVETTPTIEHATFGQVQLRVGTVRAAEPVPKSKKLLRLQIDLGEPALRQVVAGIAHSYTPEQLLGRQVVVVANLAPAKLMGVESCGMVLAAGDGDRVTLLTVERAAPAGAIVR